MRALCLGVALAACGVEPPALHEAGYGDEMRFVTYNVRGARSVTSSSEAPSLAGVLEVLEDLAPDVVVLQEVRLDELEGVARELNLPHHHGMPSEPGAPYGLAILSRWPLRGTEAIELPGPRPQANALRATIDVEGIELAVYAVHLSRAGISRPPGPGEIARELTTRNLRARQAARLAETLRAHPTPLVVLAGDLNTFPGSGAYRLLTQVLDDAFGPLERLEGSFRLEGRPDPKIDHVLHGQSLGVVSAEVVETGPSDHYPVLVVLQLPEPSARPQ